jgi:hypothetical protein
MPELTESRRQPVALAATRSEGAERPSQSIPLSERVALSPAEFAALCGRHPSWAYRLLYGGKIRALTDLGRILIPASELERVLSSAAHYDPQPRTPKPQSLQSSAKIGGRPQ